MNLDLVILCPCNGWCEAINAVLNRPISLGIRKIVWKSISDPFHDASMESAELLRPFQNKAHYALVIRDLEGSGWENKGVSPFENHVLQQLISSGWSKDRCKALIADPELESWLRFESSHMVSLLKERARKNRENLSKWKNNLQAALDNTGGLLPNQKPCRPKEVFGMLLRDYGIPPSNSLFTFLGEKESLQNCKVSSFNEFTSFLKQKFPS